jgi:hypothetical protein
MKEVLRSVSADCKCRSTSSAAGPLLLTVMNPTQHQRPSFFVKKDNDVMYFDAIHLEICVADVTLRLCNIFTDPWLK